MIRPFINSYLHKMFSVTSPRKLAAASAAGIFLGMLPFYQIRIAVAIILSLVFGLNMICILVGVLITLLFPAVHYVTSILNQHIGHFDIPFYTMRYLSFSNLIKWTPIERLNFLSSAISGLILSFISFLLFYIFYAFIFKRIKAGSSGHVFSDSNGRRWPVIKICAITLAVIAAVILSVVSASININPILPSLRYESVNNISNINPASGYLPAFSRFHKNHRRKKVSPAQADQKVFAFYVDWDENSLKSLQKNIRSINCVIPNWYGLNSDCTLSRHIDAETDRLIRSSNVWDMPLINNYDGKQWNGSLLHKLFSNASLRNKFILSLLTDVKSQGYTGINIDFENIDKRDQNLYVNFMRTLYASFHRRGYLVTIDAAASDSILNRKLLRYCDYLIVMGYDEHDQSGSPGSIASDDFIDQSLEGLTRNKKVVLGIGNYGYDWLSGSNNPADSLNFSDIMDICSSNRLSVHWDKNTNNPFITYQEDSDKHVVWFLDAATFYNSKKQAQDCGAGGIALWRLGSEDPAIWRLACSQGQTPELMKKISTIKTDFSVKYLGKGELLYVMTEGEQGKRSFKLDGSGYITEEKYDSLPSGYLVKRFGQAKGKQIALTFDDGPDSYYTPRILDILEKNNVRASFFVIGENAEINPDILQRIYNDGDDIGNHTFTHPNVAQVSSGRTKFELNSTQRLIEEITGHSTILFRAPYNADAEPDSLDELIPVVRAQQLGYIMVGESIDPLDWQAPKPQVILNRILSNLSNGNVVLLHDGGGDRNSTLAILPQLIKELKQKGYAFVTVNQLMGKNRDDIMPAATGNERSLLSCDQAFFLFAYGWHNCVTQIFYLTVVLGVSRLLFLCFFSLRQKRKSGKKRHAESGTPFMSVIIPAYNEEKVICRTVDSVLNSDYERFEIIIVDDGSKDNTVNTLLRTYTGDDRVTVLTKLNGGKASALNKGLSAAKGDIFMAIDADTILDSKAVGLLAGYFGSPDIAAVSGNVKVGNRKKLLSKWQHCEYVTGFNLERRAYSELNCITVVPGAIGAWRKELVLAAGGFRDDTLAEDTDMTLSLLEKGYKVCFEEHAKAYTESPEDIRSLSKQRFRWTYGTLQCLWKHKSALFSRRQKTLGFVSMPLMWIFQYIFQALSPIVDIYMLISMLTGGSLKILLWFFAFLLVDLVTSVMAFRMEKENPLPLLWLPFQRVFYRLMMTYLVLKSIAAALKGSMVGWNKLKRTGSVKDVKE